ncbi:MAG TPA: ketopantoate reductase family protein [Candidatus Eisenbacteria bacterium]|nr:ketopantoate reductase family protein [Candidatus Eisenbacteria bacterium]
MAETIGIVGAGSLGTLLALKLTRAGHAVSVLARSPGRRDSLLRDGLRAGSDPSVLRGATLVFLCVKSYDTEGAIPALRTLEPVTAICSLQNGWGNLEILETSLPRTPLIAGATALGAYFDETGTFHASVEGGTTLAPWGQTEFRWAEYAATLLESAGLRADAARDARGVLWRKLVLNAAVNPVSALSGQRNGAILESVALRRVAEAAAMEASRVGAALGYLDPSFDPVPALNRLLEETRDNRSSMAQDLARLRRTEIDAIVGAVVRAAEERGERVPVLESLAELIRVAEAGAS